MAYLPDLPALVAGHGRAVLMTADGEIRAVRPGEVAKVLDGAVPLVVHAPATCKRLGGPAVPVLDILELFAFVLPARSAAPTPAGLARALDVDVPRSLESAAAALPELAGALLARLAAGRDLPMNRDAAGLAARMGAAGWGWAEYVLAALEGGSSSASETMPVRAAPEHSTPRTAFPKDFPDIVVQVPDVALGKGRHHPAYQAAKSGDTDAAFRLVEDSLDRAKFAAIEAMIGPDKPIVVAVHSEEATGRNKIPLAYAAALAHEFGLTLDGEIVHANRPMRTGSTPLHRIVTRSEFDGDVAAGASYLLVDDHVSQGGTLADLRAYILQRGGFVVGGTTLTGDSASTKLAPSEAVIAQLRQQFPGLEGWWKAYFGHGFDGLTDSEARYVSRHNSADSLRNTILARGQEGRDRAAEGTAGTSQQAGGGGLRQAAQGGVKGKLGFYTTGVPMAMRLWKRLPEWEDAAPRPPPAAFAVAPAEARSRLAGLLGPSAEQRPAQADYASAAAAAFDPRSAEGFPHVVLAEAGTGTGKTLGYLAPASLWAEKNQGAVWVSTFTRHLQRQIEAEAARLGPGNDPRQRVVLRKGRENYLCLLNYEDAVGVERNMIPLGLIARWAPASADGDLMGGDLPGWFAELFGGGLLASIADRRGECIHAACPHYRRCTIEHVIRKARLADLVIANHALVMAQAVWGGLDDEYVPTRYVFDEGHHIFDAADSAFAVELSGAAMADLRRWLLGAEGARSRARGIARRLEDILAGDDRLVPLMDAVLLAGKSLPAPGFAARFEAALTEKNPGETFLQALREQARARANEADLNGLMPVEVDLYPIEDTVVAAGAELSRALERLRAPLASLRQKFLDRLEDEAETLEETARQRLEGAARGLKRRAIDPLAAWRRILDGLGVAAPKPGERPGHVFLLRLEREAGEDRDVALLDHLLDPTEAFIQTIAVPAHGMLVTSATLRDGFEGEMSWDSAEARTGAVHLAAPAIRAAFASPFDYAAQTRICVVNDVNIAEIGSLAGAFRALFAAAGGGGLGLFTAISRLRAVHAKIALPLEAAGISLYAQHVDAMDNATLVDIFRAEEHSCLLGTDAMRDGVDIPGNALRLVVFERTPWPRPDILHRTRRTHLSGGAPKDYDDAIARLRLRQAFGRLIRRADDRGVFVMLDARTPSRLFSAFPPAAPIIRSGLADAVAGIKHFLSKN